MLVGKENGDSYFEHGFRSFTKIVSDPILHHIRTQGKGQKGRIQVPVSGSGTGMTILSTVIGPLSQS